MELEKAVKLLKERVDIDRSLRGSKVESDYEKFCENECLAIETCLKIVDKIKELIEEETNGVKEAQKEKKKEVQFAHQYARLTLKSLLKE